MQRIVPSGTLIIRWIVPSVPTRRRSSGRRVFDFFVLERDETDLAAVPQSFLDERNAGLLDDG